MRPSADHVAQAFTLLLTGVLSYAVGRALWRHGRLLAIVAAASTFVAALIPIAIFVLFFWFQVFGIDLID